MNGACMNIHFHGEHANSFTKFTQLFNAKGILRRKKKKFEWTKETKQKNQNRNPATFHTLECSDNENTTNNNNNNKNCVARVFEHKWFPLHKYTLKVASFVNCAAILGCNSSRIFVVVVVVLFKYERFLLGLLFVIYFWLFFLLLFVVELECSLSLWERNKMNV